MDESTDHIIDTMLQLQTTRVEEQFISDEVQFTSDEPDEQFNSDFISSAAVR